MMAHPAENSPNALTVDASQFAVGAALQQNIQGQWQPMAFFRRHLCETEKKDSAFDRKLLAAYLAICHFRYFLEGRGFTLYTDHDSLVKAYPKPQIHGQVGSKTSLVRYQNILLISNTSLPQTALSVTPSPVALAQQSTLPFFS